MMRAANTFWAVHGELWKRTEPYSKAMERTVIFEAEDFAQAAALASEALERNWSRSEHHVKVLSLKVVEMSHVVFVQAGET